jgi:hypothetical protein
MSDDTAFAIQIMKETFGTPQFIFANDVLRYYMKVDKGQVVTFWDIPDKQKQYLKKLAVTSDV